jgi:hypothetical protein
MSHLDWAFYYAPPGGSSTTLLDNVQSFSLEQGRSGIQEPFRSSSGTLTGRVPSALPTIDVNGIVEVYTSVGGTYVTTLNVSDFVIDYGIVASEDSWTITLEDALAQAGRVTTTVTWTAGTTTRNAADQACSAAGMILDSYMQDVPSETVSAQTITNESLLTVLQQLASTEQAYIYGLGFNQIHWDSQKYSLPTAPNTVFTDGTAGTPSAIDVQFDSVQFAGIADNFFTKVIVTPSGGASQEAGSTGRTLDVATYSETNADALDDANYILAQVNIDTKIPFMISALYESQSNDAIILPRPGSMCTVILRGNTYQVYVLSRQISSVPGQTRFTYGVTDALAIGYFRLDNTYFGVLDQNKLGW